MQLAVLGPFTVVDDAQPIEVGGARLRALLIRLAASANGWVPVSELVEALWDEDPPNDEVNALQSLISRLRRALPKPELIESGPAGYRLAVDPEAVDAIRFERLAVRGRRVLADGDPREASLLLTEAVGLWRGAPLTEVVTAPYAAAWIVRLDKLRLSAVENWAAAGLQLGRHAELIAELEELAARHPLRERVHELLIQALAGTERQREALAVYDGLRRRLAVELGLDVPDHLQDLHARVLHNDPGLRPVIPPAWTAPTRRRQTNLRSPLTRFIGRGQDIGQLRELLEHSRLVTLVGTGGAGKTRLAGEVAAGLRNVGRDGVWLIELAPVTDPDDVASTALGSLDTRETAVLERSAHSHRDALSRLVGTLADSDVVLLLDNCEHLVDAAAKLAEHLLGHCPKLRVLATSREPLGIVGESLWQVHPLSAPGPDATVNSVKVYASVQLFMDRATMVRPGFRITARNTPAVAEICRRLDGLPLAIELAAARLRNLPVETVASRLSNRFRLLTGGNRTALPRHQTLRAVVAWSWDLLTESERQLAERLSVFPGGATATTAEAICASSDPELNDVVLAEAIPELLAALADKSLLVAVDQTADAAGAELDGPRYRMLETIREFAAEQLAERGDMTAFRAAHARYFLELAEAAEPGLRGVDQLIWLSRLTAERDNLLASLRFADEVSDADLAIRLGAALSWYWTLLGRHDEAATWLGQALSIPGERPIEAFVTVGLVHAISAAAIGLGIPSAEEFATYIDLLEGLDPTSGGQPLLALAAPGAAMFADDSAGARRAIERNLAHPDPWARAMLQLMSAMLAENDGELELMERDLPLAHKSFRDLGDRWGIGTTVAAMSVLRAAAGDTEGAIEALQEARTMMRELRAKDDEAYSLARIGLLQMRLPDLQQARLSIESAIQIADETGAPASAAFARCALAVLSHSEGNDDAARQLSEEALAIVRRAAFAPPQVKAMILVGLATFDIAHDALDEARVRLAEAYECAMRTRDMPIAATVCTGIADLMLASGDPEAAAELLGVGCRLRGMEDVGDPEIQRIASAAEELLGPAVYAQARARGSALARADALALLTGATNDQVRRR